MRGKQKLGRRVLLAGLAGMVCSAVGCHADKPGSPNDLDRHGDYFFLTKHYGSSSVRFSMWGKRLCNQHDGEFVILPSPTVFFPGIPLFLVENYLICPVIDLCLLPSDWWRNLGNDDPETIRANGCYVQVMDLYGRPVEGVEVRAWASNHNCKPLFYKGVRQRDFRARGLTDANGELFVPVDMTTILDGISVSTAGRCEGRDLEMRWYDAFRHPPFKIPGKYGMPERYRAVVPQDVENPNDTFPKREHRRRIVLEPPYEVVNDRYTGKWEFVPAKGCKIERANSRWWQMQDDKTYDPLTDGI